MPFKKHNSSDTLQTDVVLQLELWICHTIIPTIISRNSTPLDTPNHLCHRSQTTNPQQRLSHIDCRRQSLIAVTQLHSCRTLTLFVAAIHSSPTTTSVNALLGATQFYAYYCRSAPRRTVLAAASPCPARTHGPINKREQAFCLIVIKFVFFLQTMSYAQKRSACQRREAFI